MNKKNLKSLLSFILTIGLAVPAAVLGNSTAVFGAESGSDSEKTVTISFENGIHSVADPADANRKMVVYCMNNQMLWPHDTDSLGDVSVPKYLNGYLKASDFDSEEKYKECMDRLESVLYAGYPYNGESMYEIVEDSEKETGKAIQQKPFFKAASSVVSCSDYGCTAPEYYSKIIGGTDFVTEEQAVEGTQHAVWLTLNDYGIEGNNLTDSANALGKVLYKHAKTDKVLKTEPKSSNVSFEGDTTFRKDETSGKWETGWIKLSEPDAYEGEYSLQIPTGMTLEKNNKNTETTIWNGEEFRLVSEEKPSEDASITASAKVQWLQQMKQYRPAQEVTVNEKKFQRMIGAMVETASLQATLSYSVKEEEKVPPTDTTDPAGPTDPGDSGDSSNPGTTENPSDSSNPGTSTDKNNPENPSNPTDTENKGSKETKKTTTAKKTKTTVETGDDFNPVLYGGVALLAIAGLFGIVRCRKKN